MTTRSAIQPGSWTTLVFVATITTLSMVGQGIALAQDNSQEATFRAQALTAHNADRALMTNTPPLTLAPDTDPLNTGARDWALYLAQTGTLVHSMGDYGENLAVAYDTDNLSPDAVANKAVTSWYGESANYDYMNPGYSDSTGHFTQVVWVSTTTLGCGYATGTAVINGTSYNAFYSVCRYSPAGNVTGQFPANVQPPLPGKSTTEDGALSAREILETRPTPELRPALARYIQKASPKIGETPDVFAAEARMHRAYRWAA